MEDQLTNRRSYLIATLLGFIGGGILVTIATRSIPKIMNDIMSNMMGSMMAQMAEQGGCSPAEM